MHELKELTWQGLWKNNPGLVQLLGLCPLLAVTNTTINGLGLGLATLIVLIGSNVIISLIRNVFPKEIRIPVFVMVIAALVSIVELLMNAFTYDLYLSLGIFIPLIVTNCTIIGRAEAYASKNNVGLAMFDGLMMGLGFLWVLVLLGALRELIGSGTLLVGADLLFGSHAKDWYVVVFATDNPMLLAILPPGAFILMGFMIALKNLLDPWLTARLFTPAEKVVDRARVTGVIK